MTRARTLALVLVALAVVAASPSAQSVKGNKPKEETPAASPSGLEQVLFGTREPGETVTETMALQEAVVRLPIAAGLGALLAFRPRRRGTPPRPPPVIQTIARGRHCRASPRAGWRALVKRASSCTLNGASLPVSLI